ncbi:30S ribosomal protein S10 [Malacoplasma iowae]|uniref:Small ribosomal subunit protein uS10 n=2 Tax=Malacoplasma iowae TaxID=2116 RepID=A0A084U355_MALIO|nr:30S ribosomal protein S10 [Malacoplasma iowae]VEU62108.1 30S ribosomal protein S10 [Mycoplasmopsis fermentans]EGZ31628.1 30S ribosomal protein S10 [Malacoplasma iowae 695]KFB07391.1 ribosomal protein S10 [Malacoplasma iowae DK-CPA]QHG89964.1 30S ribosomal protein S10 [Malacoplasma iowae 695]WPL36307.1 30S ribosomal protein S10 [Malacoplasma iowae]
MKNELKIKLFSYDHRLLDASVRKIIKTSKDSGASVKGPIPLPTKKEVFTICRSPHVNKPSREQFERRTHKRLIILTNTTEKTREGLKNLIIPSGVDIQITL